MTARTKSARALSSALALFACTPSAREERAPARPAPEQRAHRDEPEHAAFPTHVRLTPAVIAAAGVRSEPALVDELAVTVSLPGELVADPDRSARVSSPIAGRIDRVSFREGSAVRKGDVLAVVRVPDLGKLRSSLLATEARSRAAQASVARLKKLSDERLASEQQYLDALAEAQALEVEARAAGEQLGALGMGAGQSPSELVLRAPIAGHVLTRNAVIGQPLGADEVLAEIADLSELWFLGRLFEKDLGKVRVDAAAEVALNAYTDERFQGVVEFIGQKVDPVARTLTARVRLTNRDALLRVGLFGVAHVSTERTERALLVPRSAIADVAGKSVVFVHQPDGDFELHELTLGASAAGKVQVVAGLREGERVVVEGVFTLKSAVLKASYAEEE